MKNPWILTTIILGILVISIIVSSFIYPDKKVDMHFFNMSNEDFTIFKNRMVSGNTYQICSIEENKCIIIKP